MCEFKEKTLLLESVVCVPQIDVNCHRHYLPLLLVEEKKEKKYNKAIKLKSLTFRI
jgi:hypothetical protein